MNNGMDYCSYLFVLAQDAYGWLSGSSLTCLVSAAKPCCVNIDFSHRPSLCDDVLTFSYLSHTSCLHFRALTARLDP